MGRWVGINFLSSSHAPNNHITHQTFAPYLHINLHHNLSIKSSNHRSAHHKTQTCYMCHRKSPNRVTRRPTDGPADQPAGSRSHCHMLARCGKPAYRPNNRTNDQTIVEFWNRSYKQATDATTYRPTALSDKIRCERNRSCGKYIQVGMLIVRLIESLFWCSNDCSQSCLFVAMSVELSTLQRSIECASI